MCCHRTVECELCLCVLAYDGPYDDSPESPDSHVTKIKVLNVTPDSTKTEETDSDNDIPTIPTGHCCTFKPLIDLLIYTGQKPDRVKCLCNFIVYEDTKRHSVYQIVQSLSGVRLLQFECCLI